MNRKLSIILLILFILFPIHASGNRESRNKEGLSIVSLAPNITEILFELGLGNSICGRTDYCNYPAQAQQIPSIGTMTNPNLERIISLKPSMVIASSIVSHDMLAKLEQSGIKTYQFLEEYNGLEGVFDLILQTGEVTGKADTARLLVEKQKAELNDVILKVSQVKDKKNCAFLISWGNNGEYAATGDTFLGKMIEYAGGINAASSAVAWAWSREGLLQSNPQVVFLTQDSNPTVQDPVASFKNTEPYSLTAASKTNQVYLVDGDSFERQGIRTVQSIREMAQLLYPEVFH